MTEKKPYRYNKKDDIGNLFQYANFARERGYVLKTNDLTGCTEFYEEEEAAE